MGSGEFHIVFIKQDLHGYMTPPPPSQVLGFNPTKVLEPRIRISKVLIKKQLFSRWSLWRKRGLGRPSRLFVMSYIQSGKQI